MWPFSRKKPLPESSERTSVQIKDYPKGLFSAYWETIYLGRERDFYAQVRFISYDGEERATHELVNKDSAALKEEVASLIRKEMSNYTR